MPGYTYDAGALIAAEAGHPRIWTQHRRMLARGVRPVVPAGVLGQVWRGGPQPGLSRFLHGCRVEELDESRARMAGVACARAGLADVVDASVVVSAARRGDAIVTSDPGDLERIAAAMHISVPMIEV